MPSPWASGTPGGAGTVARTGHQRGGHRGGLDQRVGQAGAARLLEHQHQRLLVEAQAAGGLGHERGQHAHLGQPVPHAAVELAGGRVPRGPHRGGRALLVEQVADRVPEGELVVVEAEVHQRPRYFLGRPSMRSAAMLRWISLVPA